MSSISRREMVEHLASLAATGRVAMLVRPAPSVPQSGDELLALGARDAVERIAAGDMSAEAYVTRLLSQYEANRDLNAVNAIDATRVLDAARAIDRTRARKGSLGPVAGLPFAVKDQIMVEGLPVTGGNRALKRHVARRHAAVVETLVRAGAIPFCMTALPDMIVPDGLMHQASSHSDAFGAVRNPYNRERIPGGSSGGNGAVLAARIVPAALGLDTNGSIRCPSAFCGVAGFRPSTWTIDNALAGTRRKRYSDDGVLLPPVSRLDTIGPMARTVADVAFLDALITGEPIPTVDLRRVRIAVPGAAYWERDPMDDGVAEVIQGAFMRLRDAGCRLVEIDLNRDLRGIVGTFDQPTMAGILAAAGLDAPRQTEETMAAWLREHAPEVSVEQVYHGRPVRRSTRTLPPDEEQNGILREMSRRINDLYRSKEIVAIAYPTVPMLPTRIMADGPKEPLGEVITINGIQIEEGKVLARNLFIAPRLGSAALSFPAGLASGLPVGLELDALAGNDSALLGLGIAVERAIGRIAPPPSH